MTQPTLTPIQTQTSLTNHGILLLNSNTLQDIYIKSGPLANNCEFQVHFWALVARYKFPDNSYLDIGIPTCFYNYKQIVAGATIDFEMDDVSAMSAKTQPIHNMKVNELLNSSFIQYLNQLIPEITPTYIATELNSIHRHPGGSTYQSFSSTDLKTNPKDLGVVFPYDECKDDYPTFAGIMCIDKGINTLARMEYRTVNGKLGTDILYTKHRCAALVSNPTHKLSMVEALFRIPSPKTYYSFSDNAGEFIYDALVAAYRETSYNPSTDLVIASNLETKAYKPPVLHYNKKNTTVYSKQLLDMMSFKQVAEIYADKKIKTKALSKDELIADILADQIKPVTVKKAPPIDYESTLFTYTKSAKTEHKDVPIYTTVELQAMDIPALIQHTIVINKAYYNMEETEKSIMKEHANSTDLKADLISDIEDVQEFLLDEEIESLRDPFYYEGY